MSGRTCIFHSAEVHALPGVRLFRVKQRLDAGVHLFRLGLRSSSEAPSMAMVSSSPMEALASAPSTMTGRS